METKFKIGDWVYSDYELCQVKEMEGEKVYSVTTGFINTTGFNMNESIYPIALDIKVISEGVQSCSKRLHAIKLNINHPDLHRELVRRWHELIEWRDHQTKSKTLWDSLYEWVNKIERKCNDLKYDEIDGVKIFR